MKAIGTAAMVAAGAAAVAVVVGLGMMGANEPDGSVTPVSATETEEKSPESSAKKPVTFPENAFPKEWNFSPERADVQQKLQRNVGRTVPALNVGDFVGEGGEKDLSKLRGKPILIDFWGAWCGPCRAAVPHINEIAEKHKDELHVLGVHSTQDAPKMAATAKQLKMAYPTAADLNNSTSSMFGVQWWPFYVLIDSEGKLRAAGMSSQYVDEAVQRLLDIEAGRWPEK